MNEDQFWNVFADAVKTMRVLDGDIIGYGKCWQDEAKKLARQLYSLSISLDNIANGNGGPFISFKFTDVIEKELEK